MSDLSKTAAAGRPARAAALLWAEFAVLYLVVPLMLAFALPPSWMWPMLSVATVTGIGLLAVTPGFSWRDLLVTPEPRDWRFVAPFALGVLALALALCWWLRPEMLLLLATHRPDLLLVILLLYPFLSALPQELFFRALFFRRYGALFPSERVAVLVNAAVFGLAHLFFWNWVAPALTFAGGLFFAWAYAERRSFPLAFALHAAAGNAIFLAGLGVFFYHGVLPG